MKTTCFTILAVICLLVGTGLCEDILKMSANTTTVRISNVCEDGLDIGNLKIIKVDGAQKVLANTGPFILHRGESAYFKIDGLGFRDTLILSSASFEVYDECVVSDAHTILEPKPLNNSSH